MFQLRVMTAAPMLQRTAGFGHTICSFWISMSFMWRDKMNSPAWHASVSRLLAWVT